MKRYQAGFTAIELIIALAISILVTVGAGKLFIVTLETYKKSEMISRQQGNVVFLTNTLVTSLREGKEEYTFEDKGDGCRILDDNKMVVIDGLLKCSYEKTSDKGKYRISLTLPKPNGKEDNISFVVANRSISIDKLYSK